MGSFALAGAVEGLGKGMTQAAEMKHKDQTMEREAVLQEARDRRINSLREASEGRLQSQKQTDALAVQTQQDTAQMERTQADVAGRQAQTVTRGEYDVKVAEIRDRTSRWTARQQYRKDQFKTHRHIRYEEGFPASEGRLTEDEDGFLWQQRGSLFVPNEYDWAKLGEGVDELTGSRMLAEGENILFENFTAKNLERFEKRFGYTPRPVKLQVDTDLGGDYSSSASGSVTNP